MPGVTLSLSEAAERLGVHYMTAYRYVRTGRLPAVKHGSVWRVDARDVEAVRSGRAGAASVGGPAGAGPGGGRRRRHDYHVRLEQRILAGDEQGSWTIIEGALTAGVEPHQVYLDVLAPAMALVGDRWEAGEVGVAEEHRASAVMLRLIGRLGPRFVRRGRKRGTVVIGAPAGDRHSVPVALAADLLRGAGFAVVDLGADTPVRSFVEAAGAADRLVAVGITATRTGNDECIRQTVEALHEELGCAVVVGGRAVAIADRIGDVGADATTTSVSELLAVLGEMTAPASRRARAHTPPA
jgi:excisionase family DNA binding protein